MANNDGPAGRTAAGRRVTRGFRRGSKSRSGLPSGPVSAPVFRRERVIVADDIDALGHVNNAVWVGFVTELAAAHARSLGWGFRRLREQGRIWIVQRHEIDYLASGFEGDVLSEETWVEQMRGARSIRRSRLRRVSDGALLVEACSHWAFVDADGHRPRRIPAGIIAAFTGEAPDG